jgi:hypothetical protein
MTFLQRISSLGIIELQALLETVQKEKQRRNDLLKPLEKLTLNSLSLSVNSRNILFRIVQRRLNTNEVVLMTLSDLLKLLSRGDWEELKNLNPRAFQEINRAFKVFNVSLEKIYGSFSIDSAELYEEVSTVAASIRKPSILTRS